jgi:hypothetical protein
VSFRFETQNNEQIMFIVAYLFRKEGLSNIVASTATDSFSQSTATLRTAITSTSGINNFHTTTNRIICPTTTSFKPRWMMMIIPDSRYYYKCCKSVTINRTMMINRDISHTNKKGSTFPTGGLMNLQYPQRMEWNEIVNVPITISSVNNTMDITTILGDSSNLLFIGTTTTSKDENVKAESSIEVPGIVQHINDTMLNGSLLELIAEEQKSLGKGVSKSGDMTPTVRFLLDDTTNATNGITKRYVLLGLGRVPSNSPNNSMNSSNNVETMSVSGFRIGKSLHESLQKRMFKDVAYSYLKYF